MTDFPTLSKQPNINFFSKEASQNPTIQSKMDDGRILSRAKYTSVPWKWSFRYSFLTNADKDLLEDFQKERGFSAGVFNWTSPSNSITYEVRFNSLMQFIMEPLQNYWAVTVNLIESRPNSNEQIS